MMMKRSETRIDEEDLYVTYVYVPSDMEIWGCVLSCFLFMIVGLCVVDAQSSYDAEEERSGQTDISITKLTSLCLLVS